MWCFRWFGKKNKLLVSGANRVMVSCYVRRKSLQSSCKPFKIRMGVGFPITEMVMSSSPWLRKPPKCMKLCSFSKMVITAIVVLPRSFDGEWGQQWIGQIDYNSWQLNGYNYTNDYRIRIIYIYIVIKQKWSRPSNHQTSYSHKCKRFQKHGISQAGANDGDCFWPCSYEHL